MASTKTTKSFTLSKVAVKKLEELSKEDNRTQSNYIETLILKQKK